MPDIRKTWQPIRLACLSILLAVPALAAAPAPAQHFLTLPKPGHARGPASGGSARLGSARLGSSSLGNVHAAPKPVVNGAPPVGAIHPAGLPRSSHLPAHSRPYVSSKRTISSSPR